MVLGLASPSVSQDRVVDTDQAMRSVGSQNWYDKSNDSYIPPSVEPSQDNLLRKEGWLASENSWWPPWKQRTGRSFGNGWNVGFGRWLSDWFSLAVLIPLGLMLAVVIGLLLFYSFRTYLPSRFEEAQKAASLAIDPLRMSDLPFETKGLTHANPLDHAESLMQERRYSEAIVYLYAYQLLALDQSRKIDLQKGKTNRMYLRELGDQFPLQSLVRKTMLAFEDAFFGDHEISADRFAECWQTLSEFHSMLTAASSEAAVEVGSV